MKNTLIKVLSFVMALAMLTSVFVTGVVAVDEESAPVVTPSAPVEDNQECEHQWALEAIVKEPICAGDPALGEDDEVEGAIYRVCELCGEKELVKRFGSVADENGNTVVCEKKDHSADYVYVIHNPEVIDCVTGTTASYVCPICGDGYNNIPVKALGHDWTNWETTTEPTCTDDGEETRTCKREGCDGSETRVKRTSGHHYVPVQSGCDCVIENKEALFNGTFEGANGKSIFALSKVGNCYELGYVLMHCTECDKLIVDWDDAPTHVWTKYERDTNGNGRIDANEKYDWTYEMFPANASACIQWTRRYQVCKNCGYENELGIDSPEGHNWETKDPVKGVSDGWEYVADPTKPCDNTNNYYIRECLDCDATEKGYFATEPHTMNKYGCPVCDAANTACVDCTHEGRYVICSVCGGENTKTAAVYAEHAHTIPEKVSGATCYAKAVYNFKCSNPACASVQENVEVGEKDPTNHGEGWVVSYTQPATCTTNKVEVGYCTKCDFYGEVEIKNTALGHDEEEDSRNVDPTCKVVGYDYGSTCKRCNTFFPGAGELPVDPTAHPNTTDKEKIGERYATCTIPAAVIYKYTACGCIVEEETGLGEINPDNHVVDTYAKDTGAWIESVSTLQPVAHNNATCLETGNKSYTYCTACLAVTAVEGMTATEVKKAAYTYNEAFVASMVINALGHKMYNGNNANNLNVVVPQVNETCVAPGTTQIVQCIRCDYREGGETIPAHGKNVVEYTARPATCTEKGYVGGTFCYDCGIDDGCTYCDNSDGYTATTAVLPALGHDVQNHAGYVVSQSCDTDGYVPHKCAFVHPITGIPCMATDADVWYIDGYAAATGEHVYSDWDETNAEPTCTTDGYKFKTCTTCTDGTPVVVYDEEYAASEDAQAPGHMYNGSPIELGCLTYEPFVGTACSACGKVAGTDIEHNYVVNTTLNSCTEAGEVYQTCTDCGERKENWLIVLQPHGHKYAHTVEYVFATATQDGHWTWLCAICGEEQTVVLPATQDLVFDIDVAPYVPGVESEDLVIVNGGYIEVTVSVTAEQFAFTSFKHTLEYDANVLTYVSAEVVYDFGDLELEQYDIDSNGTVAISGWTMADEAVLNGEELALVTYIFQVAPGVDYLENDILNADVWFNDMAGVTTDLNQIEGEIDVALMGDVDADGVYTPADILELRKLVISGEYKNVADINSDGVINTFDFVALANFATSATQTIEEYYAMFGMDIAALAQAYATKDYDKNGTFNSLDVAVFVNAISGVLESDWSVAVDTNMGDFTKALDDVDTFLTIVLPF